MTSLAKTFDRRWRDVEQVTHQTLNVNASLIGRYGSIRVTAFLKSAFNRSRSVIEKVIVTFATLLSLHGFVFKITHKSKVLKLAKDFQKQFLPQMNHKSTRYSVLQFLVTSPCMSKKNVLVNLHVAFIPIHVHRLQWFGNIDTWKQPWQRSVHLPINIPLGNLQQFSPSDSTMHLGITHLQHRFALGTTFPKEICWHFIVSNSANKEMLDVGSSQWNVFN